jgi:hypothetical protein
MTKEDILVEGEFGEGAYGLTILLKLRSENSARYLQSIFEWLSASQEGTFAKLEEQPGVSISAAMWTLNLLVIATPRAKRLFKDEAGGFIWQGTAGEWDTTALLVEPLTRQIGHQYLTSEVDDDALIEVSRGESRS